MPTGTPAGGNGPTGKAATNKPTTRFAKHGEVMITDPTTLILVGLRQQVLNVLGNIEQACLHQGITFGPNGEVVEYRPPKAA